MKTRIINATILSAAILFSSGCKKFLDVNTNPNVAQDVPAQMLLSSAQIYTASALGVDMNINGGIWAQYWTQSPSSSQYKVYDQYQPSANNYDRSWQMLYSDALEDLDRLEKKAEADNKKEYTAVAKIMKAYDFQLLTDAWGDIPFSEALQGLPTDGGIESPSYDKQEMVYDGIIALLTDAKAIIEGLTVADLQGDLIYDGDMEAWYRFASTLQLKCYLRMSTVAPAKAQSGISDLYATAPIFLETTAQINYISTSGNQNPLYSEITGLNSVQNLVGSATVIDSMTSNNDLRLEQLYAGTLVGIPQGAYTLPPSTVVARPSALTGAYALDEESALAPVKFMTSYESLLLQAEATARGWSGNSDDDILYADAVTASFEEVGLSDADAQDYLTNSYWGQYPTTGSVNEKIMFIITQKWFAMTGTQGFEAWTEWRRTGYPDFFTYSVNSNIGNKFPTRFLYPNVELTRNASFPGQKVITDKVWWDIN